MFTNNAFSCLLATSFRISQLTVRCVFSITSSFSRSVRVKELTVVLTIVCELCAYWYGSSLLICLALYLVARTGDLFVVLFLS